jgi:hypothetical protein
VSRAATLRALARAIVLLAVVAGRAAADGNPLAGVVLDDVSGRTWRLGDLAGSPVLLVIADRTGLTEAQAWGTRLAAASIPLAPWRATGSVAWLAVADLRRVPEYARDAARARAEGWEAARAADVRRLRSPLLLDWTGRLAARFAPDRGRALLVLLASDGRVLLQERGAPTDQGLSRLSETITPAARR